MASAIELTDQYLDAYAWVPPAGEGVCDVCHGAPRTGYSRCWSCHEYIAQVRRPVERVVPISLYRVQEQLHHILRTYKGPWPYLRERFIPVVAATIWRFLDRHRACLLEAGGAWNAITTVPSSAGRPGRHPLVEALLMIEGMDREYLELLRPGREKVDHTHAGDEGFEVIGDVSGMRVLLLDDTFTSGARVQSAASLLQMAGADVTSVVCVGRVIDPEFDAEKAALWERARRQRFTFDACCLERS